MSLVSLWEGCLWEAGSWPLCIPSLRRPFLDLSGWTAGCSSCGLPLFLHHVEPRSVGCRVCALSFHRLHNAGGPRCTFPSDEFGCICHIQMLPHVGGGCVSTTKRTCGRVSSGWVLTVTFSAIVRSFRLSPLICLGLKLCLGCLLHIVGFQVFYLSLILSGPTCYRERDP